MKKPVMPRGDALEAIYAKRKKKTISVDKAIPTGDVGLILNAAAELANAEGVHRSEVKIASENYWGRKVLRVVRIETDDEFRKRVREQERRKYNDKMYDFRRWEREQRAIAERDAAAVQRAMVNKNIVVKCNCQCKCPCR